jgi:phosphoglycolate phosphatase-like HAD superfamily hydrolase
MGGKTDPQIVREYLALMEIDGADTHLPAILANLETQLASAAQVIAEAGTALPGVDTILARLAGTDGILQSVLTGNIAPNALVKLSAFGLEAHLDLEIGAYGSDHADRRRLVPVALERARNMRGLAVGTDRVWVVGDAPNDLACARAGGVRCLLVATGRAGYDELGSLAPDALRHDLSDVVDVVGLLSS